MPIKLRNKKVIIDDSTNKYAVKTEEKKYNCASNIRKLGTQVFYCVSPNLAIKKDLKYKLYIQSLLFKIMVNLNKKIKEETQRIFGDVHK
jgi:hypothetical protein